MDASTPTLLAHGLRGMIGKGGRSETVVAAMQSIRQCTLLPWAVQRR